MTWICCSNHVFPFPSTSLDPQVLQEIRGRNREIAGETDQWLAKGQSTAPGTGEFHDSGSETGIFSKFFFKHISHWLKQSTIWNRHFFNGPQLPGKLGPRGWLGWFPTIYPSKHLEISPSWTIPCCSCPKRRYENLIWSQTWTTKGMRTVVF